MPKKNPYAGKAMVGRMNCGHGVMVDADPNPQEAQQAIRDGYEIQFMGKAEAIAAFNRELPEHYAKCKKEAPNA